MKTLEQIAASLGMNQEIEVSFELAKELINGHPKEFEFKCLNESTIDDNNDFEQVQNRRYTLRKIKRAGTIYFKGTDYETKTTYGIFELEMMWDFKHPTNFAQNANNLSDTFVIGW